MKLEKLVIYSFEDKDFSDKKENIEKSKKKFIVPINPESFTKNFKIDLDIRRGHGNHGTEVKYKSTVPEELKLDFVLDGTGTIVNYGGEAPESNKKIKPVDPEDTSLPTITPVSQQILDFKNCVYDYEGEIHRPRFLILIWGSEIKFRCVLSNLDINYTLFYPNGDPLRAKISATFLNYQARIERERRERNRSPDITHFRSVKLGDRFDLLTYNIYKDPKYVLQVGKANSLTSIRNVKQGAELYFPPFDKNEK